MKTLSVQQPWAWLLTNQDPATGKPYKPVENRDWRYAPKIRGPILIHAGKAKDRDGYDWVRETFPDIPLPPLKELKTGGVVGIVFLDDVIDDRAVSVLAKLRTMDTEQAENFKQWFFGRLGLVMGNGLPLEFHECKGQLGFFEVEYPHRHALEKVKVAWAV